MSQSIWNKERERDQKSRGEGSQNKLKLYIYFGGSFNLSYGVLIINKSHDSLKQVM